MSYSPPKGNRFRVDVLELDSEDRKHFVSEIAKQLSAATKILVLWNERQIIYVSPHSEQDEELVHELSEWLDKRGKKDVR